MLRVSALSCQRGERLLWESLNFNLPFGRLLLITGANGCGKTSLLRILAGISQPLSGQIHWEPLTQLCYLGHQPAIKNELTVCENLRLQAFHDRQKDLTPALAEVGLEDYRHYFGFQLSQGQKQRVALARLLLETAKIWILDEPLAGLDENIADKLQHVFLNHILQNGMIIMTTHRALSLPGLIPYTQHLSWS